MESPLPEGWRTVRLMDVSKIVMGQSPPSSTYNSTGKGLPFLQGKAEFTDFHPQATTHCSRPNKIAHPGSVLISVRAPVGDVNLADKEYAIGRGLAAVSLSDGDSLFLFYSLLFNKGRIQAQGSGTTFQSINRSVLDRLELHLPPEQQQRAIARALRAVQEAKEARQRELALERERKAALMEFLFTQGTRGEPTKMTEIGEVPESWQVRSFAELIEVAQGQVDPTQEPYKSMPHVGPENIEPETGRLLPTMSAGELRLISGNYLFTSRDVLYSKIRPYLRKVALPNFTGACSADMYPLRPREASLVRSYLYHLLLTESFTRRAIAFQSRTGIPKINREQLGGIPLPLPSVSEQLEIAEVLDSCGAESGTLQKEAALLEELFRAMLEELMTGRLSAVPLIEQEAAS